MLAPILNVTLNNLSRDARSAREDGYPINLGALSVEELSALLGTFAEIDALENMKADPEIRVQTRRDRFIIRTGHRKLFLHDARRPDEPAYVVTMAKIIAEIDGSAAAKRSRPPMPYAGEEAGHGADRSAVAWSEFPRLPARKERGWPWALATLVLLLAAYAGYSVWAQGERIAGPELAALTQAERLAEEAALVGVYTTGAEPGQHGIILLGDGKLKLFQINPKGEPGVVFGAYRMGRRDGKIVLASDQPGGLIVVRDRESLEFCGEVYQRVP